MPGFGTPGTTWHQLEAAVVYVSELVAGDAAPVLVYPAAERAAGDAERLGRRADANLDGLGDGLALLGDGEGSWW